MKVLEVGSWMGYSTSHLAPLVGAQGGKLYCVDPWGRQLTPSQGRLGRRLALFDIFNLFSDRMQAQNSSANIYPLVMTSSSAFEIFADETFDFIFIDGDHRYSQVRQDIVKGLKKLKPGGILCGHDCECHARQLSKEFLLSNSEIDYVHGDIFNGKGVHAGVVRAVSEVFKESFSIENDIWYVKK